MSITIRRLEGGDESVFVQHRDLLADPNAIVLVAFDGDDPVGFVLARSLLQRLAELARERGIGEGFVLTEPDNDAANSLYDDLGGVRSDVAMWDFDYER